MQDEQLSEALALDARNKIYRTIKRNPGLHFRELQRRAKIATGSLQYHIGFLQKRYLIRAEKKGKFVRYYSTRGPQLGEDEQIMALLRQESLRKIVLFLLTKKRANNEGLATAVGLSPSTVSWHMRQLLQSQLVEKRRVGRKTFFYISEPERTIALLRAHRRSFLDEMVNGFIAMWDELNPPIVAEKKN
ncbi:MAG: winged helix-turn-helix transcriptional regulator [Candidatus Diapherotrites archaeon]|nr:winged helix-turn-helix transcriptional regulator [Candidatus Diapherotrites archaeon]